MKLPLVALKKKQIKTFKYFTNLEILKTFPWTNLFIVGVVICSSFISIGCSGVEGRGVERGVD